ncbi:MAG: biopolymer transporter ExbD [Myxococcales bacterium]|nr:biopolymer transporter ExbD [Myxococcales bacterium]
MAASSSNQDEMISGINVTPLVDVVLVLLVILMVTATTLVSRTISVDLPKAATGQATHTLLAITLDRSGKTYLDAAPVDEATLSARVRAAKAADSDLRATIAADGAVPHRRVVRVIDLLRREGVERFALNVQPTELR